MQNRESWCTVSPLGIRGVAQPGSAPALGAGSRGFKSRRPDQPSLVAAATSYGSARQPSFTTNATSYGSARLPSFTTTAANFGAGRLPSFTTNATSYGSARQPSFTTTAANFGSARLPSFTISAFTFEIYLKSGSGKAFLTKSEPDSISIFHNVVQRRASGFFEISPEPCEIGGDPPTILNFPSSTQPFWSGLHNVFSRSQKGSFPR